MYQELVVRSDWRGYTLRDVRQALRELVIATLDGEVDQETVDYWRTRTEAKIDYLLFGFGEMSGQRDDGRNSIATVVERWGDFRLQSKARSNLAAVYSNGYFFNYIGKVELPKLVSILADSGLSTSQSVEYFVTQLVYPDLIIDHPGVFVSYSRVVGVSPSRVSALDEQRDKVKRGLDRVGQDRFRRLIDSVQAGHGITSSVDAAFVTPIFEATFLLMTFFVGSSYRRVHDAVVTLLDDDMGSFRGRFFAQLPDIIARRGGIRLHVFES